MTRHVDDAPASCDHVTIPMNASPIAYDGRPWKLENVVEDTNHPDADQLADIVQRMAGLGVEMPAAMENTHQRPAPGRSFFELEGREGEDLTSREQSEAI